MAHDGHAPGNPDRSPGIPGDTRTDRPLDRSVETRPRALYLWQIAVLEARLETQQARAQRAERDRQHVIDRYEGLLDDRATGELYTDGGRAAAREQRGATRLETSERGGTTREQSTDSTAATVAKRTLDSVRSLL